MKEISEEQLQREHHEAQKKFKLKDHLKCKLFDGFIGEGLGKYGFTNPCKGLFFFTEDTPYFLSGQMRVKGNGNGEYPDHYLEVIEEMFGKEPNTIEVCSRTVKVDKYQTRYTVDKNADFKPTLVCDATQVHKEWRWPKAKRWRGDPPYNDKTASGMYQSDLPNFKALLVSGAKCIDVGSFMFLLLGPDNYQHHPWGVIRVGLIYISVTPNNETRCLNIYYKWKDYDLPFDFEVEKAAPRPKQEQLF